MNNEKPLQLIVTVFFVRYSENKFIKQEQIFMLKFIKKSCCICNDAFVFKV
jgi:hypothetical protein